MTLSGVNNYDQFGFDVSMSNDGNTIAVGSKGWDSNPNNTTYEIGETAVYDWNGSAWVQRGTSIQGVNIFDQCGFSVSLSGNGNRMAIGYKGNSTATQAAGLVRIFDWNGSAWVDFGLGNAAIGNLDAGKITAGIISAIEIRGGDPATGVYPFTVSPAGFVTASSGTIAGFSMNANTLHALDGNVRVEAFTNASPVYIDGTVGSAYEGGFGVKFDNGSTYRSTMQTYDGHYVWSGNGSPGNGYSALKAGVVTVSNDDRRMWMDFASSTGALGGYTPSFPSRLHSS
jgi:hypothetical protein